MSEYDDDFFVDKRPWSLIKDNVLKDYIPAYVNKVKKLNKNIMLIDGYAGPGVFKDGSAGSPMIICQAAEKHAKGQYSAHFYNIERKYHEKLGSVLNRAGWSKSANCYLENSLRCIKQIPGRLKDDTVFLYLDPFGLKGCGFEHLEPFLNRGSSYSTEILLTMCMPVVHRLAGQHALKKGQMDNRMKANHQLLTAVFGGEYWKDILLEQGDEVEAETKQFQLIDTYLNKLRFYLPYAGCCPVRRKSDSRIKYFMVFVSRHQDAILLMNNSMHKAYYSGMHQADYENSLWGDFDWREMPLPNGRNVKKLSSIILDLIAQSPGDSRESIWLKVVQNHFMDYDHALYLDTLKHLSEEKKINYQVDPRTNRRNGNSKLFPASDDNRASV